MLFGSFAFMNRRLRGQWTTAVIVCLLKVHIASSTQQQIQHDNVMKFSGDFEGFLKDLGTMVYKSKKSGNGNDLRSSQDRHTTPQYKNYRKSQNVYNSQKSAIGDVLMMKLVSYYEDKYKLAHLEPTTTESITYMHSFTNNVNKYNFDGVDTQDIFEKYQTRSNMDTRNRRMQESYARKAHTIAQAVEDDGVQEVVIL